MEPVSCPHCGEVNQDPGRFCEACGQALPGAASTPQISDDDAIAQSSSGRAVQGDALQAKVRTARGGLLAVAILQLVGAGLMFFVLRASPEVAQSQIAAVVGVMGVLSVLYFGLWIWAKRSPFPAALVGLIVFVTLWLGEAALDPTQLFSGILIKGIIVFVLARAVSAGVAYRRLQRSIDEDAAVGPA